MSLNKTRNFERCRFPVIGRDFKWRLRTGMIMSDKLEWIEWMNLLPEERFVQAKKLVREFHLLSKGSKEHGARSIHRSLKSS